MKPPISDQLKNLQLDAKTYGALPVKEDIYFAAGKQEDVGGISDDGKMDDELEKKNGLLKQWKLLLDLKRNLNICDQYLISNKGETLKEWSIAKKQFPATNVIKGIGDSNDETGGITVYFLNLQNFYDEQEQAYDDMEAKLQSLDTIPEDIKKSFSSLRKARGEKRKIRRAARKLKLKDLKLNEKGYIVVEEEKKEEPKSASAESEAPKTEEKVEKKIDVEKLGAEKVVNVEENKTHAADAAKTDATPAAQPNTDTIDLKKASQKNIKIAIFGTIILITAFALYKGYSNEK